MDFSDLLGRLVAFDTSTGNASQPAAMFAADYLDRARCRVDLFEAEQANKVNVLASAGPADGRGLLLCGHLDVVPAQETDWETNPFRLAETESAYVGRGVADMKSFVALAMQAMAKWARESPKHGLSLLLTYDEELGCVGAQDFAQAWDHRYALPGAAVVGEPTELGVFRAHKGHLRVRLKVRGVEAHSSCPDSGSNAIEKAAEIIRRVQTVQGQWRESAFPDGAIFTEYPYPTASVTTIYGGTVSNVIPESCVLEVSIRTLPSQKPETVIDALTSALRGLPNLDADDVRVDIERFSVPMWTDEDAPIHRELRALVGQEDSLGAAYTCDAGPLSSLGLDCVLFGPGSIRMAHRPNESIPKEDILRAEGVLADLIRLRCM